MDDSGHARIADFGLATVARNADSMPTASQCGGFSRWTAPEVLNGEPPSKEMDIFSFAMVMIEVRRGLSTVHRGLAHRCSVSIQIFTGAVPFPEYQTITAMLATARGERPPRPTHPTFTDDLWGLMERCWNHDPHLRPEIPEALKAFLTPLVSRPLHDRAFVSLTTSRLQ